MRFAYAESMCEPILYPLLAQAAEECGFHSFLIPDSICYPQESDTKYPYTDDGDRTFLEDKPFIDPFVQATAMGAITEKIRFLPFVIKAPIRHPVLLAKQAMSTAVMTGDRLLFGLGLSPWPEDYAITGERWEKRGRRFDEMIEIIRGLMAGGYYSFQGEFYDIPAIKMSPVPSQRVPIFIGGHSEPALKRAARMSDGWVHAGAGGRDDTEELTRMIQRLQKWRREYGREYEPFRIFALSPNAYDLDGLRRLEDLGVTDVGVGFRQPYEAGPDRQPLEEKLALMREYAETIIKAS